MERKHTGTKIDRDILASELKTLRRYVKTPNMPAQELFGWVRGFAVGVGIPLPTKLYTWMAQHDR